MTRTGYKYLGDPMPHEKVDRNASLVQARDIMTPQPSFRTLGRLYGITGTRAHQIYTSAKKKEEMYGHR